MQQPWLKRAKFRLRGSPPDSQMFPVARNGINWRLGYPDIGRCSRIKAVRSEPVPAFGTVSQLGLIMVMMVGHEPPAKRRRIGDAGSPRKCLNPRYSFAVGQVDWATGTRDSRAFRSARRCP